MPAQQRGAARRRRLGPARFVGAAGAAVDVAEPDLLLAARHLARLAGELAVARLRLFMMRELGLRHRQRVQRLQADLAGRQGLRVAVRALRVLHGLVRQAEPDQVSRDVAFAARQVGQAGIGTAGGLQRLQPQVERAAQIVFVAAPDRHRFEAAIEHGLVGLGTRSLDGALQQLPGCRLVGFGQALLQQSGGAG